METAGKTDEACDAFEASNRIEPRAGTLIRLGQCREKQGRMVSAWSAYKDALTRVKDPAKRQIATTRVSALEPTLSYLTVLVSDEARIEGLTITRNGKPLDPILWNRAAPVDGGVYTISGQAPGHEAWSTTVEVANTADKAAVEVPRFKELKAMVDTPPPDPTRVTPPEDEPEGPSSPGMFTPRRKIAVGVAATGVAIIAVGAVFGMQAKGLEDDAYAKCPDPAQPCDDYMAAQDLIGQAASKGTIANVALGVGAAAVVGGAVLWFMGAPSQPKRDAIAVQPRLGGAYAGVDVAVRF